MSSTTPNRGLFSRLGAGWHSLSKVAKGGVGLVLTLLVLGVAVGVVALTQGSEAACNARFCAQLLSPEGSDVDPMTPVRIQLRGVDQQAALAALKVSNEAKGTTKFDGDVLTFTPEWPGFARGAGYDVNLTLDKAQTSTSKKIALASHFTVGGKLAVAAVLPSDGTQEVAQDTEIYVQFNRSVAPLTVLAAAQPTDVLSFEPPIEGSGRWLNTSLYVFTPAKGWLAATAYTGKVRAGLTNQLGAQLDADVSFKFETVTPAVVSVSPVQNSKFVSIQPEIKVEFNQPVERASAEQRFVLQQFGALNAPVPGSFEWLTPASFVFRPDSPLALGGNYDATIASGVSASEARAATKADFRWNFATVEAPRVVNTTPRDGDRKAPSYGVRIQFATPMDRNSVEQSITIEPKPSNDSDPFMGWDQSDLSVNVGASFGPSKSYKVTLAATAKDRNGIELGQATEINFTTAPMQPNARMFRSGNIGTFDANQDPTVMVSSWNVDKVEFKLYKVDQAGFLARQSNYYGSDRKPLPDDQIMRTWSVEIPNPPLDTPVVTEVRLDSNGPKLPEGFYVVTMSTPNLPQASRPGTNAIDELPVVLSSVNLVTKWTDRDVLVWALDMKTGQPKSGWRFDVIDGAGHSVAKGTAGNDGVARIDVKRDEKNYQGYYVVAKQDNRLAFSGTNWNDGISPYNYGSSISFNFTTPPMVGHLFTDRPIYRPSETVYIKGTVRLDDDASYSVPTGTEVTVSVRDQKGRDVLNQKVTLSDYGTFDTSLSLANDAGAGVYSVSITGYDPRLDGTPQGGRETSIANLQFRVAEFVKPQFEVKLTTDKEAYINGEQINAEISAQLFFGSPLANAALKWQVTSSAYTYKNEGFSNYQTGEYRFPSFGCMGGSSVSFAPQRFVRQEGTGVTDADGKFYFSLPADVAGDTSSQAFTIEAYVTDESQQQVAEYINVPVHKGRYYIGVRPDKNSVRANEQTQVSITSIDPLANKTIPNVSMDVGVFERKWRTVRERAADGQQVYKSVSEDTPVESFKTSTGGDGLGSFNVSLPRSGQFYVLVSGTDDLGNKIESSMTLWSSGNEFASWHIPNDDRFTLVADKDEYKPGETARILVAAPFEGASTALVSQERGKVLAYETRRISGNAEVLELPIVASHAPNFYLSVVLFKAPTADNPMPQVKFGLLEVKVSNADKKLNITLEPNASRFYPRDSVSYTVRTTDSNGRGVPAEVSLAMVDKAVLSLQDDFAKPGVEAFWSKRPLGVMTASSFVFSVDRANQLAKSIYPGGKGGGGGLFDDARAYFPNTAYWEPSLHTDESGRATVEVKLPDSLTTWRLTARGLTTDTKTGEGRNEIITSRDLVLRPDLPRFLVAGDEAKLGAIVNNTSLAPLDVSVTLTATGVQVTDELTKTVSIPAGRSAPVSWYVKALVDVDEAGFEFRADAGTAADALSLKLPIDSYFTAQTVATAGAVTSKATEAIQVPSYVLPDSGGLTVNVSPSLLAGVNTGYDTMKESKNESAETTVSRFVAALALDRAVKQLKLTDIEQPRPEVQGLIQRALQRLYDTQNKDGGWGWFQSEKPEPMMTAYTLWGLGEANRAGLKVDDGVEQRAAKYLLGELNKPRIEDRQEYDLRAFMVFALAKDKRGDLARSYALAEQREALSNTAKSWLAQAISLSGGNATDPRLTSLLADLQSAAIASATGTHWEETAYSPRVFGSDLSTTTQVMQALNALQPENPLIDGAVRWLMIARKGPSWGSSYNTALSLTALTDFMASRGDLQENFDYKVVLNGRTELEGKAAKGDVQQEASVTIDMRDLTKDALNDLLVSRAPDGDTRLYYTAQLRYFTPAAEIEAESRGIGVSHEYFRTEGEDTTTPVRDAKLGEMVKVKVTLVAPSNLQYVQLSDYLPAGLEPLDTSLKITPLDIRQRMNDDARVSYQVNKVYSPFSSTEVYPNRVELSAYQVRSGIYEYSYYARATTAGSFRLPPATAQEKYFPEVAGQSDGGMFTVTE